MQPFFHSPQRSEAELLRPVDAVEIQPVTQIIEVHAECGGLGAVDPAHAQPVRQLRRFFALTLIA